ncbi:MAG: DNA polymerase III subunit alpha [Candidatus Nealsonbacteria bacterium]|nr:DNA polymerase III subunit alpha [Candidatus Nealsonbacteria bacterium]
MKFTHLHVHSHYSLLDGLPKIDELLDYVKHLGMDSVALTDHGVLYGAVEFYKKAKEKGVKPIIGAEVYVAPEGMLQKRPNIDDKRYHLILLAKNETGYKNLVKLITRAHLDGFYYKPRIDEEILEKHADGLIALTACIQGKIPRLILAGKIKEAEETATKYQKIFGPGNFYLELQRHPKIKEQTKVNKELVNMSEKTGIPLVATNDIHYLRKEDADAQDVLMLINTGADPNDPERLSMKEEDFSMKKPEEMQEEFKEYPEALANTQKIADACDFNFELGKTKLPYYQVPDGKATDDYLKELCYQRLENRFPSPPKEVIDRLEYELAVIKQTGFASYFLIVQDFVNWAKENRIVVGPGRGSAAGSLVSYVLNITNVDPLAYNLLFERFINPERISMPDIDLDFTDRRRDEVIEYVSQKYGRDRVAQIITFGTMAARAVIRDVGRALGYPYGYCDKLAKMVPFGFSLEQTIKKIDEFKQMYEQSDDARRLIDLAKKLEGVVRHASTHACGVVISKDPLENIVPLQHPTQNEQGIVSQYEMHSIEDLGILKMDFLGLKNLTIIEDTLARVYKVHGESIDIQKIPMDDEKAYRLLQRADTVGVFQLESSGMQRYLKQLKPTEIEDIIAMVALYRPGPIQFIPDYIARKHKKKKIDYIHPKLEPILKNTQGICIYQEQLMQIAQQLAGFTLGEADVLRKAVGKKIKSLLDAQQEKFIASSVKNGIEKNIAQQLWEWILPFARYGFNRSHAASYATIAYQTAWLKCHYPVEFMAAVLTSEKADFDRISLVIGECKKGGIEVLPPDINESFMNFSVVPKKNQIRFGLLAIKNVGQNIIENILKERKEGGHYVSIDNFVSRVSSKDLNKKSLESLIKAGAFDKLGERNQLLTNLEQLLSHARETQKSKANGQKGLFDLSANNTVTGFKMALTASPTASGTEKLTWEKELLGLYVSGHPIRKYKNIIAERCLPIGQIQQDLVGKLVKIGGVISSIKKIITKKGQPMMFVNIEDETSKIEVVVFPSTMENYPTSFQENKVVMISGKVDFRDNLPKIICNTVEELLDY